LRSLSRLALAFVLLFATLALTTRFPFTPFDPGWQGRLARTLLDSASLPLLALALLPIGRWLDPADPLLKRRQRSFSRLAGAAALGFLLLVPLQISANLRLEQLGGPRPAPADLPLPLLKAQANAALDQVQLSLRRQCAALPAPDPLRQLPELLRPCSAALSYAFAFASLARGSEESGGSVCPGAAAATAATRRRSTASSSKAMTPVEVGGLTRADCREMHPAPDR
jgi:hypothetical protein